MIMVRVRVRVNYHHTPQHNALYRKVLMWCGVMMIGAYVRYSDLYNVYTVIYNRIAVLLLLSGAGHLSSLPLQFHTCTAFLCLFLLLLLFFYYLLLILLF